MTRHHAHLNSAELRGLLERRKAIIRARDDLVAFARYMTPSPKAPDDVNISLYQPAKHHKVLGAALEKVERHEFTRLQVSMPPRHGKTKLSSHLFSAWYIGRNPEKSLITATYSEKFAWDHGRAVRDLIQHPHYRQVFPNTKLKDRSASVDRLETTDGGVIFFVGRGSGATGRGGDVILIDDPIKDRREADSPTIRDQLWAWYTQVIQTRLMTDTGSIVLIQTRWHEDDLIGRLTDPQNGFYSQTEAKKWRIIDMPAIAREKDVLGRKEGEPLWPERFGKDYLDTIRETDRRGFQALYQGRPSPEEGSFFKANTLRPYFKVSDVPKNLRYYAASDHAVSLKQGRDKTCLMVCGVDEHSQMWIMHDLFWQQADSKTVIEMMINLMDKYKPIFWFAEKGHITASLGPFLRERMKERGVYCAVHEMTPVNDKLTRAQSINAKMLMQEVVFPTFPRWWADAHDELLKFPTAAHDDFCDTLSLLGLGVVIQHRPNPVKPAPKEPAQGSLGWVLENARREKREEDRVSKGW